MAETERSSRNGDDVYERLRLALLTGAIRPNAPLIEADLAAGFAVSRTPIREALQRLAAEEMIVPRKRGWAAREYSPLEIEQNYELRAALEGYAARLAALRGTDEEIGQIAEIQDERERETAPTLEFRTVTNRQFHDAIITAARNDRLATFIFKAGQFYFNERIAAALSLDDFKSNQRDHAKIVDALRRRDPDAAELAMRNHIANTFSSFKRLSNG